MSEIEFREVYAVLQRQGCWLLDDLMDPDNFASTTGRLMKVRLVRKHKSTFRSVSQELDRMRSLVVSLGYDQTDL